MAAIERALGLGGKRAKSGKPTQVGAAFHAIKGGSDLKCELVEATRALNTIGAYGRSLRNVASALRCWGSLCDELGVRHFPVTAQLAGDFGRWHRCGDTFAIYLAHVKKGCTLVGACTAWYSGDVVRGAVLGLGKLNAKFKPPKLALSARDLMGVFARCPANSAEKLFVVISWVFMLRAASECVDLTRVVDDGRELDPFEPPTAAGAIGMWRGAVTIRLKSRKNRPVGDIIARGCSCSCRDPLALHCDRALCAVCVLWPAIRRKIPVGERLFGEGIQRRALAWLVGALAQGGVERGELYTLHSLRRGAAREMVARGGTEGDLCAAGSWSASKAARTYLDMVRIDELAAPSALASATGDAGRAGGDASRERGQAKRAKRDGGALP